ncbi:nucleotidyltransferase family protein [Kitasatospora sp. NPDC087315]|uniref:nucleotidyltransferase family protein n=1 Tax=Kitasatospora sp. NPDC087315 TaxID=3364069 RepID=UPI00382C57CB
MRPKDPAVPAIREALLWAAGRPGEAPDFERLDPRALFEALTAHRLEVRLWARLQADPAAGPAVDALRERLTVRRREIEEQTARQVDMVIELTEQLRDNSPEDRLMVLKGVTLYGLGGDPAFLRRCADADVIALEPARLLGLALKRGYRRFDGGSHLAAFATLESAGRGEVDIHSYFPVTRLGARPAPRPADHPGHWEHTEGFLVQQIMPDELTEWIAPVRRGPIPSSVNLLRAEVAALIHSSHLHVEALLCVYPTPAATIRLAELATVVDLCALPEFDPDLMAALIERYRAGEVFSYTRTLAVALLQRDPFAGYPELQRLAPVRESFPVDLWWDGLVGFAVDLPWDPEQLVFRDLGMRDVLCSIGAAELMLTDRPTPFSTRLGEDGALSRAVVRRAGNDFEVRGSFEHTDEALLIELAVPAGTEQEMTGVSLNFGDHRYEYFYWAAGDLLDEADYSNVGPGSVPVTAAAARVDGQDLFRFRVPLAGTGAAQEAGGEVTLLAGVRRQRREWGPVRAGAILPLLITVGG